MRFISLIQRMEYRNILSGQERKKDFPARLALGLLIISGSGIMNIWKGKMIL